MSELFVLTERPSVYLASKSPRRQELLRQLGVEYSELLLREAPGRRRDIVEAPRKDEPPLEYVKRIARTKASLGWHRMQRRELPPKPVLGADTTEVVLDGTAVGKPADAEAAVAMLVALSGRTHDVITAVAVRWQTQLALAVSTSQVTFRALSKDEVERYVAIGESLDKAGGYGIQGKAAAFVQHLEGSYSGVMGLPLFETAELLARLGFPVLCSGGTGAMTYEILINVTPQETRVAMLEQGVVQELHVERASARGLVGNIYLGRVARVLPGMQSAFIEIGLERAAFLHIADIWEHRQNGLTGKPIERILHEGQSLLVQVIKDPIGTKGARLSTQVSLAGRLLVYLPRDSHIGISQRIEDEAERESLRIKLQQLLPEGLGGGFIIRTMAETASEREMQNDIEYLTRMWHDLVVKSDTLPAPSLVYQDLNLAQRVLRDMATEETARILVDSRETFQKMQEFAQQYTQNIVDRINHYTGERPLFDLHGVEDEIEKALARRVDLKSGGYLIIDQTEAMTTIDVNTGGFVGGRSFDDTIFKTNLEAALVIARQLRLRNLGGIIIIDFIDMENLDHRASVLAELDKALDKDRTRLTVNGFTQLGLVEMTRKRTRESLAHVLCEPCATCGGRGEIKTAQTVCYEILREIVREAKQFNAREYRILAAQSVIDLFLDEESQSLAQLGDFIGRPISLQVETLYTQEQYDVILI